MTDQNKLPLVPTNVAASLGYSPDSVVSRQLWKTSQFNVTLFAVAAGQGFDKHTTTKNAIVHILEGVGEFLLTDKWYKFKTGDYFYMPPNLVHALRSEANFKFLLYTF